MKVFNSKLAAIGLAAFVFASCSDSSSDPATPITSGTVPSEITKIGLTQTDAAQLAASVTNYKRSSSNKARTRAIDETLFNGLTQMPNVPSNEDAVQLNAAKDLSNEKYKTRNGKTYDFSNNTLQNATLFVVGNNSLCSPILSIDGRANLIKNLTSPSKTNWLSLYKAKHKISINK